MPNTTALTTRLLVGAALAMTAALASAQPIYRAAPGMPSVVEVRHERHHMHRPPPPRYESRPRARPGHAWVGGHWRWQGQRHVWVPGHWVQAPRAWHRPPPPRHYGHR